MWLKICGLVDGGAIKCIKTISKYFLEASRFWTFDVDDSHQTFNYWISAFPGTASFLEPIKGVDTYLQYTKVDTQALYQSSGFVQINDSTSSGFELLPKSIFETQVQEEDGGFAWISPDSDEHAMIPLMRLCSGSLLNTAVEEPTTEV